MKEAAGPQRCSCQDGSKTLAHNIDAFSLGNGLCMGVVLVGLSGLPWYVSDAPQ